MTVEYYNRITVSNIDYDCLKLVKKEHFLPELDFNQFIPCPEGLKEGYQFDDAKMAECVKVLWRDARDDVKRGINTTKNAIKMANLEHVFSEFYQGKTNFVDYPVEMSTIIKPEHREEAEKALENYKMYGFASPVLWMEKNWGTSSNALHSSVKKCKKNTYVYFITQGKPAFTIPEAISEISLENVTVTFSSEAMPPDVFYEEEFVCGKGTVSGFINRRENHSAFMNRKNAFHTVYPGVF